MIYIWLNLGPILLATAAGLVAAILFYRLARVPLRPTPTLLLTALLSHLWLAAILAGALILAPPQAPPLVMAMLTPVVIWAGFSLPLLALTAIVRGGGLRQGLLDSLQWVLVMLVQAIVLTAIGLVPPPD
jgi:hypothetical protein